MKRRWLGGAATPWLLLSTAWLSHGCGPSEPTTTPCVAGSTLACACEDGRRGAQTCADDGESYEVCRCGGDGGSTSSARPSTGAAGDCAGGACTGCAGSGDPDWSGVLAYFPCTVDIADASGRSQVSIVNHPHVASTPPGAPGGASCNLGNAGSYGTANGFIVALPAALGTGDFTVEFSVYETAWQDPTDGAGQILIAATSGPTDGDPFFPEFWSGAAHPAVQFGGGSNIYVDTTSALDRWESYAASRVGGTTRVFRDGVQLVAFADTNDYTDAGFDVSHQQNGNYNAVMGAIAQIRVTARGRYTAAYTPCADGFAASP